MTSNIGSPILLEGVTPQGEIETAAREQVMRELRQHFRPEFLNRVDETILFKPLRLDEIRKIVDLLATALQVLVANQRCQDDCHQKQTRGLSISNSNHSSTRASA